MSILNHFLPQKSTVFTLLALLIFGLSISIAQDEEVNLPPIYQSIQTDKAQTLLNDMTLDEKIGQLFMVAAYSNKTKAHEKEITTLIRKYDIGGLIFMQGGPLRQAKLNNIFQEESKIPLLIAMDAEWGLSMRLDSVPYFPRQMAMGAMDDPELVYEFGLEVGRELKRLGVHVNFAPVVDVNNNPANPVINNRAFGEDKYLVSKNGIAYMKGLQDAKVLACAKHFPGHGDTDTDSHKDLPIIPHTRERLEDIEFYPFKQLIQNGLGSAMIAHLYIPNLDSTPNLASTLSKPIVTGILREEMGFDGLVFTDAMTMEGVAKFFKPGEMDVKALVAGNDMLLFPKDVGIAVTKIKDALDNGILLIQDIDTKVLRILQTKEWSGALDNPKVELKNLHRDLNSNEARALRKKIIEKSITLLKNYDTVIPITDKKLSIATLTIGEGKSNAFNNRFDDFYEITKFTMGKNPQFKESADISKKLVEYDLVIVNMLKSTNKASKNYGITHQSLMIVNSIAKKTDVILSIYANPYCLQEVRDIEDIKGLVIGYHDNAMTQKSIAEMLVGASAVGGKLPISANLNYKFGQGINIEKPILLNQALPEHFGVPYRKLMKIDTIVNEALTNRAFPGCRVMAVKDGKIIFDHSYGYQTYEEKIPVNRNTVYDIASITKIAATIPSLMALEDQNKFDVKKKLGDYYKVADTSGYKNLELKEMLAHQAQLKPWIPFYLETMDEGELRSSLYRTKPSKGYTTKVISNLYILDSYKDSIFNRILSNGFLKKKKYRYSDLGYYFFKEIVEDLTDEKLEDYVANTFYKPLGLKTLGYFPLNKINLKDIAPTEYDLMYRRKIVKGFVHDPGAAMLGGVGGHAGVFSTGYDLAVLMQMYMNGGTYGGKTYFSQKTIDYYTTCHYCDDHNRRGLGFDKPAIKLDSGPSCNSAPASSYGHSGFTGTLTWVDPENGIIFVFLSNRVYPNAENRKIIKYNTRTRIQQVIYDAFDIPFRAER